MNLLVLTLKKKRENQTGINMVDLMMWLVIAALLLAAAIQGIGFYQQTAYVYQLQQAVDVAAGRVVASSTTDGSIDADDADAVVADVNAKTPNDKITLTVETVPLSAAGEHEGTEFELASVTTATTVASSETLYLRATHDLVANKDVVYFFAKTSTQSPGVHIVAKGSNGTGSGSATPAPSGTATPTPTATATTPPYTPLNSNAASATIVAPANESTVQRFGNKSIAESTTGIVYIGFSLNQAASSSNVSNFKVEWSDHNASALNAVVGSPSVGYYGTQPQWSASLSGSSAGLKQGTYYATAKVTNLTTTEVSYKTWTITVVPVTLADTSASGWSTPKTFARGYASNFVIGGFKIVGAAASDFTITYSGGAAVNVTSTSSSWQGASYLNTWVGTATPGAGGLTAGSGPITVTATSNITGQVYTRTFSLTVT
jgi:hypothetical protein